MDFLYRLYFFCLFTYNVYPWKQKFYKYDMITEYWLTAHELSTFLNEEISLILYQLSTNEFYKLLTMITYIHSILLLYFFQNTN